MSGREVVGRMPTVAFRGGATAGYPKLWPRVAYDPPGNTMDPRYVACTDHRVACDCREAEWAEDRQEWKGLLDGLGRAAWSALAGHQVDPPLGLTDFQRHLFNERLCLCSGCAIHRGSRSLLPGAAVDIETGRVRPAPDRNSGGPS